MTATAGTENAAVGQRLRNGLTLSKYRRSSLTSRFPEPTFRKCSAPVIRRAPRLDDRRLARPPVSAGDIISETSDQLGNLLLTIAARFSSSSLDEAVGAPLRRTALSISAVDVAACGRILADAGLLDEAEAVHAAAVDAFPDSMSGSVGLAGLSMRQGRWSEALVRWDALLSRGVGRTPPQWTGARATVLANLGRADEAESIFRALIDRYGDHPAGHVGLAQLAMLAERWETAADQWGTVISRFGDQAPASTWKTSMAAALLRLGETERSENTVRNLLSDQPASLGALVVLLSALVATGRPSKALAELESSPLREVLSSRLKEKQLQILIALRRIEDARQVLRGMLASARAIDWLECIFKYTPLLEGGERAVTWSLILERADGLATAVEPSVALAAAVLGARARLALRDRAGFMGAMRRLADSRHLGPHGDALRAVEGALSRPRRQDNLRPKLFGIGLSKTGTTSLAAAFRRLGWNTLDWSNPLTCEIISEDDLDLFDAFTDTPCCIKFEYWYYLFPNSKFVFTHRRFEPWIQSMDAHWRRHFGIDGFANLREAMDEPNKFFHGQTFRNLHRSIYTNFSSYKEAYTAYNTRVRHFFHDKPPERFLEFDLVGGQGWRELCEFVGAEIPDTPFPHENRRRTYAGEGSKSNV